MSIRELLETYPLYRKLELEIPLDLNTQPFPVDSIAIKMTCKVCNTKQTFNRISGFKEDVKDVPIDNIQILRLVYRCTSCRQFFRFFLVRLDKEKKLAMKVGQEPPHDITMDPDIKKSLGGHTEFYRKALVSESHSFGIGAFAYYRRVLDDMIDGLLEDIAELIEGEEDKALYAEALAKVKRSTVTQEKIRLVKDLLPAILRPEGMNPLAQLHSVLSEGLHYESDERCLELAELIKQPLVFLVRQVSVSRASAKEFTENMKRLLSKSSPNSSTS